jgi:hypothetical protein
MNIKVQDLASQIITIVMDRYPLDDAWSIEHEKVTGFRRI